MTASDVRVDITDGWHPTVNPSARMPIHHFRFVDTLGRRDGLLNEFPRRRGGSTIRIVRFADDGPRVIELPGTVEWVPWWLPAQDNRNTGLIGNVLRRAVRHGDCTASERETFHRTLDSFESACLRADGGTTVGEVVASVMDTLTREVIPTLPRLDLVSITRSPLRHTLAQALSDVPGGLAFAMGRWADATGAPMWPLIAVATDEHGNAQRIRFHAARRQFDISSLGAGRESGHRKPHPLPADDVVVLLDEGRLVPSARLLAMAEVSLAGQGTPVRHFGNTYGHTAVLGRVLKVPGAAAIPCYEDDRDSWHYAVIAGSGPQSPPAYPLHLLDIIGCSTPAKAAVAEIVDESMRRNGPVPLEPMESLDATILVGRARLFGQEDRGPQGAAGDA